MDADTPKSPEEVIAEYREQQRLKKAQNGKILIVVLVIFSAILALGSWVDNQEGTSSASSSAVATNTPTYDDSWVPTGFTGYPEDDNLAWRWATKSEVDCTYSSGACWSVVLISKNGCPSSLYGEVNIFDKNDIQISYTNDSVARVQPMQKVKLTFDTLDDAADTASISKFSCY
jgi:hypothetical protein